MRLLADLTCFGVREFMEGNTDLVKRVRSHSSPGPLRIPAMTVQLWARVAQVSLTQNPSLSQRPHGPPSRHVSKEQSSKVGLSIIKLTKSN